MDFFGLLAPFFALLMGSLTKKPATGTSPSLPTAASTEVMNAEQQARRAALNRKGREWTNVTQGSLSQPTLGSSVL